MKKIFIITVITLFASTSAYAASGTSNTMVLTDKTTTGLTLYGDSTTASATTALIGKTSTGVGLGINTSAIGYALVTQHLNGTKAYGSSYDSTSIYAEDATVGTPLLATPTDITTADFASWTAL
jgi:hypothetical protein